jgi:DNA-binding MarR family transcriptional regulator
LSLVYSTVNIYAMLVIPIKQQRAIRAINSNPDISLRDIVDIAGLGGVTSASRIINSLESKGYLKKIGVSTNKKYQLTPKALRELRDVLKDESFLTKNLDIKKMDGVDLIIDTKSTSTLETPKLPQFISTDFATGSTGGEDTVKSNGIYLLSSITKIITSPAGFQKYGDEVVLAVISGVIVLPSSRLVLGDQWIQGCVLIVAALLLLILFKLILNKK